MLEESLSYCRELIGDPNVANGQKGDAPVKASDKTDEWEVWKLLLTSTEKIGTDEYDLIICWSLSFADLRTQSTRVY